MMSGVPSDLPYWWPYLHYGYLPPKDGQLPFDIPRGRVELPPSLDGAATVAGKCLADVIHGYLEPGRTHLIPLSGGLDSRALLAAALEAGVDILTVTFGTPGTLDYEYGKRVARAAGVRHESIPLPNISLTTDTLVYTVRVGGAWTYLFDACYNRILTERFAQGCVVLHGFVGDPVAGSHYPSAMADGASLKTRFAQNQNFLRGQGCLLPSGMEPAEALPDTAGLPSIAGLTPFEVMDFSVRQRGAIRPIVVDDRYDVRTPFSDTRWLELMFSAPPVWRQDCRLYEAALFSRWPDLFGLPTKNRHGYGLGVPEWQVKLGRLPGRIANRAFRALSIQSPFQRRMLNYTDFAEAFRVGGCLYDIAQENLGDLSERGVLPWIDPMKLLSSHTNGSQNLERQLQLLIGLEINLKVACE